MKIKGVLAAAIVVLLTLSLFFAAENFLLHKNQAETQTNFYVGVECGYNNVTLCKALIDKVKDYTNLFIVGSTDIVKNVSQLKRCMRLCLSCWTVCFGLFLAQPKLFSSGRSQRHYLPINSADRLAEKRDLKVR